MRHVNDQKQVKPVWKNSKRVNHQNFGRLSYPNPKNNIVPQAVLTKSVSLNTARPVNTAQPRTTMNDVMPKTYSNYKEYSSVKRPFNKKTTNYNRYFNKRINIVKGTRVNTARPKAVVNAVKASACWVWKPKHEVLDHVSKSNSASKTLTRYAYVDALGRFKSIMAWVSDHKMIYNIGPVSKDLWIILLEHVMIEEDTIVYWSLMRTDVMVITSNHSGWLWFGNKKDKIRSSRERRTEKMGVDESYEEIRLRVDIITTARLCVCKLVLPVSVTTARPALRCPIMRTSKHGESNTSVLERSYALSWKPVKEDDSLERVATTTTSLDAEQLAQLDEDSLGEDLSKQGRIDDAYAEVTLVDETSNDADKKMFDVKDCKHKNNKITKEQQVDDDKETD
ncbi:hypothetical protein Tco_1055862 [Tanacetum coccineum]|uniref:Uncharacterized protein n=1 Tax=Tanacetum coccineum TaxID=301880 RepID=A0ABQ5H1I9_9ASTR